MLVWLLLQSPALAKPHCFTHNSSALTTHLPKCQDCEETLGWLWIVV